MRLFNKVAVIGIGLIGGSLALAIKRAGLARQVIGVSRKKKSILLAKKIGAIDAGSTHIQAASDADVIILATPVNTIVNLALRLSRFIKKDAILTDVGSTKTEIVSRLSKLFPYFVGGHPLAGSERRSIAHAQEDLFKNSTCVLTPISGTDKKALGKIKYIWQKAGAKVVLMSPRAHDNILSFVSHLPHVASFSLINSIPASYLRYGSSGLKDTTRIAGSDPALWTAVLLSNRKNILKSLGCMETQLQLIKKAVTSQDMRKLHALLRRAQKRKELLG